MAGVIVLKQGGLKGVQGGGGGTRDCKTEEGDTFFPGGGTVQ